MTWRVAKLNGADSQGTVDLAFVSYKPGKQSTVEESGCRCLPGFTLSTDVDSAGHYTGPYEQETTVLLLPAPDGNPHKFEKIQGWRPRIRHLSGRHGQRYSLVVS